MKRPNGIVVAGLVGVLLGFVALSCFYMYEEGDIHIGLVLLFMIMLPVHLAGVALGSNGVDSSGTSIGVYLWLSVIVLTIFSGYRRARVGSLVILSLIVVLTVVGLCRQMIDRDRYTTPSQMPM